jgi:glutamine synthetase
VRLLPKTARLLPWEDNTSLVLGEFTDDLEASCPRGVLRRVIDHAAILDFTAMAGCEYEFLRVEKTLRRRQAKTFVPLFRMEHVTLDVRY